jgi:cytidylate kinase
VTGAAGEAAGPAPSASGPTEPSPTRAQPRPVIAIDGPAGSGKSTVSRALASRLGIDRLDTGAMYRAVAWAALQRRLALDDRPSVAELAENLSFDVGERVEADGTDITDAIRGPEVSGAVSAVAANPGVRAVLVRRQRAWMAARGGGVVEGRDIGSVVFPDADVKIFLTASTDERARRRPEEGADALTRRDRLDSTRDVSPLGVAEGARVIDTTDRAVDDIVDEVLAWL